jgi:hypothetical protein
MCNTETYSWSLKGNKESTPNCGRDRPHNKRDLPHDEDDDDDDEEQKVSPFYNQPCAETW